MNSSRGEEEDNLEEEEWSDEFSDGSYYSDSDRYGNLQVVLGGL